MSTLREYNHGTIVTAGSFHNGAITFTPSQDYNIDSCKLKLYRTGTPGTLTVYIYATSEGVPSGSPLTSGTYNGNSLSDSFATPSDVDISFTPYLLSGGTEYAIVGYGGGYPNYVNWLQSSNSAYTDGVSYYYSSGWNISPYDFIFETYGDLYAPTVTTQAVSSILSTTATGKGNVTSDGGATVTERGVCWSTSSTPTTAGSKATASGTTGSFTASMTGLSPSTLYYVRAYAINSVGTSYGNQVTFTTKGPTLTLGEYIGAGSGTTKLLLHLNGNSTDSSGNGNNGTDTSITYSLANGKFGQGAGFNGTSSKIKCTPAGANIFTVLFWMNATALTNTKFIVNRNRDDGKRDKGVAITTGNKLRFNSYDGATANNIVSNLALSTGVWYHIAAVVNGTSSALYINGNLDNTGTIGSFTTGNEFHCGASGAGGDYFSGKLDEIIVEDRAWTASEIRKLYTYQLGRF